MADDEAVRYLLFKLGLHSNCMLFDLISDCNLVIWFNQCLIQHDFLDEIFDVDRLVRLYRFLLHNTSTMMHFLLLQADTFHGI